MICQQPVEVLILASQGLLGFQGCGQNEQELHHRQKCPLSAAMPPQLAVEQAHFHDA